MVRCMHTHERRGVAVVSIIIAMLVITLVMIGFVLAGARDQDLTVRRLETVRAFYAAESGANMAIREMIVDVDGDGDGAIGTISDDGSDANDPSIGNGRVKVTKSVVGLISTMTSHGRSGDARRKIEVQMQ
jgi:hypothetical protein